MIKRSMTALTVVLLLNGALLSQGQANTTANEEVCLAPIAGNPCLSPADNPDINKSAANPVNLSNGNKFQEELDYIGYGEQSGLKVFRYYNSTQLTPSLVGRGWLYSYGSRLYWQGDRPQILLDDSTRIMFQPRKGNIASSRANEVGYLQKTSILGALEHVNWEAVGLKRQPLENFFSTTYLNSLSNELWLWRQPSGALELYNQHGNLIMSQMPYGDLIFIEREVSAGPMHEAVLRVQNQHQQLLAFHYTHEKDGAYLSHIKTPEGDIHLSYEWADDPKAPRLVKVTRPDGSHVRYHYEDRSTSPFLVTRAQHYDAERTEPIKDIAWRYDNKQRAIETHFHRHEELSAPLTMHFNYIKVPEYNGDVGLTEVRQTLGEHTTLSRFHTLMAGAQFHITKSEGFPCFYCPSPGLEARYNEAGQVIGINHLSIRRRSEDGRIDSIGVAHAGWPGLRVFYDESGKPYAWSSHYTGKTFYEIDPDTLQPKYINYANKNGRYMRRSLRNNARTEFFTNLLGSKQELVRNILKGDDRETYSLVNATDRKYIWLDGWYSGQTPVYRFNFRTIRRWSNADRDELKEQFINKRNERIVKHQLPESGSLYYEYDEQQQLNRIQWLPANDELDETKPKVIYERLDHQTRRFANQLVLKADKNKAFFQNSTRLELIKEEALQPYWLELRYYQPDGLLSAEHNLSSALGINKYRRYNFNHVGQLIRVDTERVAVDGTENTTTDLYTWQQGGINLAQQRKNNEGEKLTLNTIKRDKAGFVQSMNGLVFSYDMRNLLTRISGRDGETIAEYEYDALGHRIRKTDALGETQYYYLNDQLAAEAFLSHEELNDPSLIGERPIARISRRYIYDGILPVALIDYSQNETGQLYFIHSDGTGQPFLVTDEEQEVVWLADNDSFGQSHVLINKIDFNLRLPGQYYDTESGLHHNHYRYYDPMVGHYLEPDPLGPLSSNEIYGYANQNPRQFIDPLGLLMFAFDGTTNTSRDLSNAYKLGQLYDDGPVHYVEGIGTKEAQTKVVKHYDAYLKEVFKRPTTPKSTLLRREHALSLLEWEVPEFIPDTLSDQLTATMAPHILNMQWMRLIEELLSKASPNLSSTNTISIDLVGFSRGAALASIFANKLGEYTNNQLFSYNARWLPPGQQLVKACVNLRFVGLFDTVHQLGLLGAQNKNYNYAVSPAWATYAHAIALNEHRTIMPLTSFSNQGKDTPSNVYEYGFLGSHSDVGGIHFEDDLTSKLNPKPGVFGDLGKIPFNWMYTLAADKKVPFKNLSARPEWALDTIKNPLIHYNSYKNYKFLDSLILISDRKVLAPNNSIEGIQHHSPLFGNKVRREHAKFTDKVHGVKWPWQGDYYLRQVRAEEYLDFLKTSMDWESATEITVE